MEIWKDIPGWEGLYQASNFGRIRSVDRYDRLGRFHKGVIRQPGDNGKGYLVLPLKKDGRQTMTSVHRLVASTFLPNPNKLRDVNHIDGNKKNNRVDNLEWCSHRDNDLHAFKIGLKVPITKPVRCIETGEVFKSAKDAELFCGIKPGNGRVRAVCDNRYGAKTCGGYHWEWV